MKYLAILFGACLALTGCVIETSTGGGEGGSGNSGNNGGNGGEGGAGVGGGEGGAGGGQGGAGGGGDCLTCGEYITPGEEGELCDGESSDLYDELVVCICGTDLMGAGATCYNECADTLCMQLEQSADCTTCVLDTVAGCGNTYQTCSNDI